MGQNDQTSDHLINLTVTMFSNDTFLTHIQVHHL